MAVAHMVAVPVVAGLLAGTGAVATYVSGPASTPTEMAQPPSRPCDAQTWPYIDSKCLTRAQPRVVRVVAAPRADDATDGTSVLPSPGPQASVSAPDHLASPSGLTARDTVLHQPDALAPAKDQKARVKRAEGRAQRGARTYQVPSESRRGSAALIVVRPLRLDQFR
jgi:hypothetical protein